MGSFSDYAANKVLDHYTGKAAWTMPTVYVALFVGDPEGAGTEVSGGSYARKATAAADWNSASGRATSNAQALTFPQATGSWGTVDYFALYDAAMGGNRTGSGALGEPKTIGSGDWELIERNGLIYLTKHGYGIKIVLSLQNAKEVRRLLDAYLERRAYEWAASYGSAPGGKE